MLTLIPLKRYADFTHPALIPSFSIAVQAHFKKPLSELPSANTNNARDMENDMKM